MASETSAKPINSPTLARTPLFDLIVENNARLTEFAGWEMPVQYTGLKQEHFAVRNSVGMFDISHMGKFKLQGKDLLRSLQFFVPSDLERLQSGQAQYTVLLNPEGGIIDDIIIYYQGEDELGEQHGIMIVNAATRAKDKAWLKGNLEASPVNLEDISKQKVLIAVQGPQAAVSLQPFVEADLTPMKAFTHLQTNICGKPSFVARTGYTGEDGFEIMLDPDVGVELWRSLVSAGVTCCGLGARDTLRLEAGLALYGQDIDNTTTPFEAGLGWLVHLESKGDFIGRAVLEAQKKVGLQHKLVGLQMEGRYIARHDYPVVYDEEVVGKVTSGTFAPTLGKAIALAYVPTHLAKIGQQLAVEIRSKTYPAQVVKKPFYRSPTRPSK
ncbi:MAG: glycine cleavage system aminomethyltransferase GcvT [Oscillatoria sp. PMC 1051.18]|nr:glycine cleavage system aminomethyltransferase GcvT [Oscillatoria sp. PMC 1050.18]MEC5029946.1 glycine cleavage system aminomethyltransferase GcvT [Oscillatoria sp. PMC 1051.18]